MACRIGIKEKEREREREKREEGKEDKHLTSLEREVLTLFAPFSRKKIFIVPTMGRISIFFFFFKNFERGERRPARKIRIFVSYTWKRKVGKFFSIIRFDSMTDIYL